MLLTRKSTGASSPVAHSRLIRPVSSMEEVLKIALIREPTPVVWEEAEDTPPARLGDDGEAVVTH